MKTPKFTDKHKFPAPYVRPEGTDITKAFARERRRLAELAERQQQAESEALVKVLPLKKGESK